LGCLPPLFERFLDNDNAQLLLACLLACLLVHSSPYLSSSSSCILTDSHLHHQSALSRFFCIIYRYLLYLSVPLLSFTFSSSSSVRHLYLGTSDIIHTSCTTLLQIISMPQADTNADMLYMHSFLSAINDYRDSGFLSDCRLRINVNDHHHHHSSSSFQCEEFLTHRLVLAAGSPYFKELLVKESTDTPSTITIHLHSIDAINCFKVVLDYLYTGKVHMNNCEPINVSLCDRSM
jgi:hypothetical protein